MFPHLLNAFGKGGEVLPTSRHTPSFYRMDRQSSCCTVTSIIKEFVLGSTSWEMTQIWVLGLTFLSNALIIRTERIKNICTSKVLHKSKASKKNAAIMQINIKEGF